MEQDAVPAAVDYSADYEVVASRTGRTVRIPLTSPAPPQDWYTAFRTLAKSEDVAVKEEPDRVWLVVRLSEDVTTDEAILKLDQAIALLSEANDRFIESQRRNGEFEGAVRDWWTTKATRSQ